MLKVKDRQASMPSGADGHVGRGVLWASAHESRAREKHARKLHSGRAPNDVFEAKDGRQRLRRKMPYGRRELHHVVVDVACHMQWRHRPSLVWSFRVGWQRNDIGLGDVCYGQPVLVDCGKLVVLAR
eukprot:5242698-Prymnesium_polylepis.1